MARVRMRRKGRHEKPVESPSEPPINVESSAFPQLPSGRSTMYVTCANESSEHTLEIANPVNLRLLRMEDGVRVEVNTVSISTLFEMLSQPVPNSTDNYPVLDPIETAEYRDVIARLRHAISSQRDSYVTRIAHLQRTVNEYRNCVPRKYYNKTSRLFLISCLLLAGLNVISFLHAISLKDELDKTKMSMYLEPIPDVSDILLQTIAKPGDEQ